MSRNCSACALSNGKRPRTSSSSPPKIEAIGKDRRKLSADLIETAARLRGVEGRIGASEARLEVLDENEAAIRKSLEERRGIIAELLATLQRMGRRPPPALMVRPEDALTAVRTAIMLGAVVPEMRNEIDTLAADLAQFVHVRQQIGEERAALARDFASLTDERQRMTLLVEERQKRQAETEKALDSERQRALALARQADNLKDLLAKIDPQAPGMRPQDLMQKNQDQPPAAIMPLSCGIARNWDRPSRSPPRNGRCLCRLTV